MKSISKEAEIKVERKVKVNNSNSPIFCYITFRDHYKNKNIMDKAKIIEDLQNPVILKRFGTIEHENDDYIVIKTLESEELNFICKSCIKEKIIYLPRREDE